MAVPKKRTGHSAQGKRRANWKAEKPALSKCSNCGATVLAHTVCPECGFYKGKPASNKIVEDKKDTKVEKKSKETEVKEEKTTKKPTSEKKIAKKPASTKAKAEKSEAKEEKTSKKEDK